MNGYERTIRFVNGEPVDRPPFMPMVVDWVYRQLGVDYHDFIYCPRVRARAYLDCCARFDMDCIMPDADFYEQLEDFGMKVELSAGRYHGEPFLRELETDVPRLKIPQIVPGSRMGNRLDCLKQIAAEQKGKRFLCGIVVGPFTEYTNARGMQEAMYDLFDDEENMLRAVEIFCENGINFLRAQLQAGADGIIIVEPSCSLISPAMYEEIVFPFHQRMVTEIHQLGGISRIHICGDTNRHAPIVLRTGVRILDADFPVRMDEAAALLGDGQVLCGNLSPAEDILAGKPETIREKVQQVHRLTGGRAIIAAGCDIPPDTSAQNMDAFYQACLSLAKGDA